MRVNGDDIYFQFVVDASAWAFDVLKNGMSDNELSVVVRLQWQNESKTGYAYQDFVYLDEHVGKTYKDNVDLYLSLNGFETLDLDMDSLTVKAMVVSNAGVLSACNSQSVK